MPHQEDFANRDHPTSLARIAVEIAAARFELALLRAGGERKYREDQSRVPKAQTGAGQFADEGRGTSRRPGESAARIVAPAATRVLTRPAARAAAGAAGAAVEGLGATGVVAGAAAVAAPLAVGAGAMSSVTGFATHYMTGAPVTPFLHIPGDPDDLKPHLQHGKVELTPDEQEERDSQCEEQLRSDDIKCQTYAAMYGKGKKGRARIAVICKSTAMDRYAQCLIKGPSGVKIPLFTGGN